MISSPLKANGCIGKVSMYAKNTLDDASQKNKVSPSCLAVSGAPALLRPLSGQIDVGFGKALEGVCK